MAVGILGNYKELLCPVRTGGLPVQPLLLCLCLPVVPFLWRRAFPYADTERDRQTKACKGDALRLCALAIPNEKKIAACMARKKEKLSPACREYFKDTPAPPAKTKAKGQAGRHTTPAMH